MWTISKECQHQTTSEDCKRFAEIRRNRKADVRNDAAKNVKFYIHGKEINTVQSFKYLGRIISNKDNDLEALENQLKKARMTWGRIGKVIKKKTNGNPKIMSIVYKVVIQSVLLYGSESWVLDTQAMVKFRSFHRRCARYITGRHINLVGEEWEYPSSIETLEEADLLTIEESIRQRKETILGFAETLPILQECIDVSNMTKNNRTLTWWKKEEKMNEKINE